eukprot:CAMPEP_0172933370 /NCGR_PEP_ID=MMETSP1075-20121228/220472_1 /TAXON_ID=2916 /ORGANISM="Ceratium fusus, Strain PA161109" /LENGTH=134 /DNA_ID=CAMNT_0013794713 /DNA_START=905 /DNA_END=1310 /DNA_ORIENTATION=+
MSEQCSLTHGAKYCACGGSMVPGVRPPSCVQFQFFQSPESVMSMPGEQCVRHRAYSLFFAKHACAGSLQQRDSLQLSLNKEHLSSTQSAVLPCQWAALPGVLPPTCWQARGDHRGLWGLDQERILACTGHSPFV